LAGRAAALLLAGVIILFFSHSPVAPEKLVAPALVALLVATVLGAPVFTTIGGAALILFWGDQSPIATIPLKHYSLVTNPSLPTIPLFTLAGYFLAEGGASRRLVGVSRRCSVHCAAVRNCHHAGLRVFHIVHGCVRRDHPRAGGLLMPVLLAARYSERDALGC